MAGSNITFACGDYDRTQAIRDGSIKPDGLEIDFIPIQAPREIFDRMVQDHAFDMSELSSSEFISMTGKGECPFVALPVFPSKAFRHGFICINRNAGIATPKDLEGKRIGTPLYTQTAAIWIRGMLADDYGVDLSTVQWVQGSVEQAGSHGDAKVPPLLKPVDIEFNTSDKSLGDLLADGEIDAILGSRLPLNIDTHPDVTRLFPNFREDEKEYYKRTGIHPIMHLVVIRQEVYDANPAMGQTIYDAFCAAKHAALEDLKFSGAQKYMLPWLYADLAEAQEVFGDDPWPYGIEPNRRTLEALIRYMVADNFIAEPIDIEKLFLPLDY